jgi:hypothetical protein
MKLRAALLVGLLVVLCAMSFAQQQVASSAAPSTASAPAQQTVAQSTPKVDAPALSPLDGVNESIPKWIRFSGQVRFRAEGYTGGGFNSANSDGYLLTQLFLNLKLQPTRWMKFYFQSMDSHAPWKNALPANAPFRDTMDLRLGYVEFGDVEKPSVSFRFGRQELDFGEGRLVGLSPWANTPRSFDGFRTSYVGNGYRLDGFAATVVPINQNEFDWSKPGNNLYGVYSSFKKLVPKATFEPYLLWRRQAGLKSELAVTGVANYGTYGVRWVGKLPANFDYNMEISGQHGSLGTESISAWASHWALGYSFPKVKFAPRFFAEYNYASGDKNPTDNTKGTFDQLYPSGHDKYGLTDQFGWENISYIRTGPEFKFTKRWTGSVRYNSYWLADVHDGIYNSLGAVLVARRATGNAGKFVGQGFDVVSSYKVNSRLTAGGGYGKLFAGTFLKNTTPGTSYNYPYLMTTYSF